MSISTALLKRSRAREPGTSARCSIRRAGGGSTLMGRSSSSKRGVERYLFQRQPLGTCRDEDRLSALSDDLLLLILGRVNTRTALGAGPLSRRWAHLPRELTTLELRAGDVLPPRYDRLALLFRDLHVKGRILSYQQLEPILKRYERRAVRAFSRSVQTSFLEGPRRKVDMLRLEFFTPVNEHGGCENRLVAEAIDAWGVEDLEVVARLTCSYKRKRRDVQMFPIPGLCKDPGASLLQSLTPENYIPPRLHGYRALTALVLKDIPSNETSAVAYERIFVSCPQIHTLHMVSCDCRDMNVVVDAPHLNIRELVVDNCSFGFFWLRTLPRLERLASLRSRVWFDSNSSFPCLRRCTLSKFFGFALESDRRRYRVMLELDRFFPFTLDITSLIVRFTGPERWIAPSSAASSSCLPLLRRLMVADVPSSWDAAWPLFLLEMAPSLEVLHIHIAPCGENPGEEMSWRPTNKLRLNHLKEFVVVGFEGTERQIYFVKSVVGRCKALRQVALFRNGHAQGKGNWDWEMVTPQHSWTHEEKENIVKQIMESSLADALELVFG